MGQYKYTGSAQFVTVAVTGEYDIVAFGAQGGGTPAGGTGGLGAEIGGDLELTADEKLEIIVGGAGGTSAGNPGGGGGGSFVLANIGGTYTPLIVAGGGGGGGGSGAYKVVSGGGGLTSRGNGQGGYSGAGGAGGAGVKSNGQSGQQTIGGFNRTGNYTGGTGAGTKGGFGGGGSGNSSYGGGGGGGYSGGFGGNGAHGGGYGGGGSSYDGGVPVANQTAAGENEGNGRVVIFPNVVCFASGTRIRSALGSRTVEDLVLGDIIVTASGAQRPIRWVGHRTIDCRRHPRPAEVMPVRIAAHAFGPNKPARDLYVSPGHAICIDMLGGVLIPAGSLVNGSTIVQVDVESVTYWHVELDEHEIILAEELPSESYLEMGNRDFFAENVTVALAASPDTPIRTHADFCRPYYAEGSLVDAVRARLHTRAAASDCGQDRDAVAA